MQENKKVLQRYQNKVNNAQGHFFEGYIKAACIYYRDTERAAIEKIPEPFRVTKKQANGIFTGRFIALAQPDFQGTISGGQSICFEAKYTSKEKMNYGVLTAEQIKTLEMHQKLGAITGVCIGIQDRFYFVPWSIWRDMKKNFGRKYITQKDIETYRVKFNGAVMFLDYIKKQTVIY